MKHGVDYTSYYVRNHAQAPSLIRARRPYLVKNALTGVVIAGVVLSIYAYTIKVIGQDDFEDVKVPDAPRKSQTAQHGPLTSPSRR